MNKFDAWFGIANIIFAGFGMILTLIVMYKGIEIDVVANVILVVALLCFGIIIVRNATEE